MGPPMVNLAPFFQGRENKFQLMMSFLIEHFNTFQSCQIFFSLVKILKKILTKIFNPPHFWVKNQKFLFFCAFFIVNHIFSLENQFLNNFSFLLRYITYLQSNFPKSYVFCLSSSQKMGQNRNFFENWPTNTLYTSKES